MSSFWMDRSAGLLFVAMFLRQCVLLKALPFSDLWALCWCTAETWTPREEKCGKLDRQVLSLSAMRCSRGSART